MSKFEEDLSWILSDFKSGKLNFQEATLKIEDLIVQCLGLNAYLFTKFSALNDYFHKEVKE